MAKPAGKGAPPRTLIVQDVLDLTPNMRRIRFTGEDLRDFPNDQESGYVKLVLEHQGVMVRRTYTVRRFDPVSLLLDVDFVMHCDGGPASAWAAAAKIGDSIPVGGPGPKKLVDLSADWFLIAGDMTALPAISVNIELLPEDAKGYVAIEILHERDRQDLKVPPGVELHWVVNAHASENDFPLLDKVKEFEFLRGRPSIWVAGEFHTSRAIRRYLKLERTVARDEVYASSYWHIGLSEDRHKVAKAADQD